MPVVDEMGFLSVIQCEMPAAQGAKEHKLTETTRFGRRALGAVVATGLAFLAPQPATAEPASAPSQMAIAHAPPWDFADLAAKLLPSVVNISARSKPVESKKDAQDEKQQGPSSGSPFEEFFKEFMERNGQNEQSQRRGVSVGSGFVIDAEKG